MKKFLKVLILVFFLLVIYSYTLVITNIPEEIILFQGESLNMINILGINFKSEKDTIETSSSSNKKISESPGKTSIEVSLLDKIFLKEIEVDVIPKTRVIPVGDIAGLKLYTSGVLVVRNVRNRRRR